MRRSDTSRACAFSAAVTALAPRDRPGLLFCGLVVWVLEGWELVVWEFVSGDAKCLLFSAGEGRLSAGEARRPAESWIEYMLRLPQYEATTVATGTLFP